MISKFSIGISRGLGVLILAAAANGCSSAEDGGPGGSVICGPGTILARGACVVPADASADAEADGAVEDASWDDSDASADGALPDGEIDAPSDSTGGLDASEGGPGADEPCPGVAPTVDCSGQCGPQSDACATSACGGTPPVTATGGNIIIRTPSHPNPMGLCPATCTLGTTPAAYSFHVKKPLLGARFRIRTTHPWFVGTASGLGCAARPELHCYIAEPDLDPYLIVATNDLSAGAHNVVLESISDTEACP